MSTCTIGPSIDIDYKVDGFKSNHGLVMAHFIICCSHPSRHRACAGMARALCDRFLNIRRIKYVVPVDGTPDACLVGDAVIDPKKKQSFKRALMSTTTPHGRYVTSCEIMMPSDGVE